jgi:hypothetical protein
MPIFLTGFNRQEVTMAKRFWIIVFTAWLLPVCAWALTQADVPVIYKNIEISKGKPVVMSGDARLSLIAG